MICCFLVRDGGRSKKTEGIPLGIPSGISSTRLRHLIVQGVLKSLLLSSEAVSYTHLDVYKRQYLGKAVAMALLDAKQAKEGTELEVEVRGRRIGAKIVPLPFYKRG